MNWNDRNWIKIIIGESIFTVILIFISFEPKNIDASVGLFDKLDWAKEVKVYLVERYTEQSLLNQIERTPGLVRENWELGLFYLNRKNDPEKAILYFTKGFENDIVANYPFRNQIFQSHILLGYDVFKLSDLVFSYWEMDSEAYERFWKEKYDRAKNFVGIANGMEIDAIQNDPRSADFFNLEANLNFYEGNYDLAESSYKNCIVLQNNREECFVGLALVKMRRIASNKEQKSQFDSEALSLIQRSLQIHASEPALFSKHALFSYWIQNSQYRKNQLDAVKKYAKELSDEKPDIGFYQYVLALTYLDNWNEKNIKNMLNSFKIAHKREPHLTNYCSDFGYYTGTFFDSKKGIEILEDCKSGYPPDYMLLSYLGDLYMLIGDFNKSKELHTTAETNSDFNSTRDRNLSLANNYSLAKANLALGEKEEGIKYLDLACEKGNGLLQACDKLRKETE